MTAKIEPKTSKHETLWTIIKLLIAFLLPIGIVAYINTVWVHTYWVPSASMENTLQIGDRVLGLDTHGDYTPERGDIIVFEDTQQWIPQVDGENQNLVKRVIGLPGDTITCCTVDGQITINGEAYDEPYVKGANEIFPEQVIPEGHIFVMGDNRENSADSRYHIDTNTQYINLKDVKATVFLTYWPFQNFGTE